MLISNLYRTEALGIFSTPLAIDIFSLHASIAEFHMTLVGYPILNTKILSLGIMLKYSIKYAPDHTVSHWTTKKLHTVGGGGGTPPSHTLPHRSLRSLALHFLFKRTPSWKNLVTPLHSKCSIIIILYTRTNCYKLFWWQSFELAICNALWEGRNSRKSDLPWMSIIERGWENKRDILIGAYSYGEPGGCPHKFPVPPPPHNKSYIHVLIC